MRDDEEAIYDTMSNALLAGRLTPGAPLRETVLAEVFGVSRERIRKILLRLGTNRLIDLVPNRGAFVAAPSLRAGARHLRRPAHPRRRHRRRSRPQPCPQHVERLQDHIDSEAAALARGDRAESVRLSAEFHVILAEATGNAFIVQQMRELVSRTSMLVAVFEAARSTQCSCDEHRDIFSALQKGDGTAAAKAMRTHLSLIETRLRPGVSAPSRDAVETLARAVGHRGFLKNPARRRPAVVRSPLPAPIDRQGDNAL